MVEQLAAQVRRGLGQTTGIGHRVESAGAAIEQRGRDLFSSGGLFAGSASEQLDGGAAAFPLFLATAQIGFATGVMRHVQSAFAA
ncbi:hypothetical protein D3C73_1314700 [compost metagenome]